jgi:hypothetical protein
MDGSFSWKIPHLYYAFGGLHFKINAIDLGSMTLPDRTPIVDFQRILPRDGPDWPGANRKVALGTIIQPVTNNLGKYLFQATCSPGKTSCSPGSTGEVFPSFLQGVMTDTTDGAVVWRNIGTGFGGSATSYVVGGVSKDDDVFVKGFSDEGGLGGLGDIFVAAYKRSANDYYLYNTGTGIISYWRCEGGTGFMCSGGFWAQTVIGMTTLPDRFLQHKVKISKSGEWVVLAQDACLFQTCSVIPGGPIYFWKIGTTSATVTTATSRLSGNWTEGFKLFVNADAETGTNLIARLFTNPEKPFPLNSFSFTMPVSQGVDIHPSWNYNDGSDTTPVCTATTGFDWPYTVPWENEVVCYGTNSNPDCPSAGHGVCRNQVKRFFHTYNPATCNQNYDFSGCWGTGALSPDGKYYAFTSNWGDTLGAMSRGGQGPGSCNGGFNFQKNHVYQLGDVFEPVNSDGHPNDRYSVFKVTVAGSSGSFPPGAWPKAWSLKDGNYQNGATIMPLTFPNNPCNHQFQVTAGGGAGSGPNPPIWKDVYGYNGSCSAVTTGATVKDGGITWTDIGEYVLGTMHLANMGADNCRSDVFIGVLN